MSEKAKQKWGNLRMRSKKMELAQKKYRQSDRTKFRKMVVEKINEKKSE